MVSGIPVDLKADVFATKIWKIEMEFAQVWLFWRYKSLALVLLLVVIIVLNIPNIICLVTLGGGFSLTKTHTLISVTMLEANFAPLAIGITSM